MPSSNAQSNVGASLSLTLNKVARKDESITNGNSGVVQRSFFCGKRSRSQKHATDIESVQVELKQEEEARLKVDLRK